MLDEGQQGKFRSIIKAYGLALGFIVLFVWVIVLVISLILHMLCFRVPEILVSSEAQISAAGYCWLFSNFYYPRKRGEEHYRLLTILGLGLIIGAVLIITGVYNIALAKPNVFIYLCLIIGTALIFINVKNWYNLRRP